LYRGGAPSDYEGGRTTDAIVNYVVKKSGPPSNAVDCDGLKKLTADNKFVIAYFGADTEKMYTEAHVPYASAEDKIVFAHTSDAACATGYGAAAPGIIFFRKFETETNVYSGAVDKDSLVSFVKPLMVPTVFEFSEEEIEAVFGQQQPTVLLFRSDASDKDAAFMATFEEAAKANKGKMLFGYSDVAEGIQERLAEFVGINESQMPSLRAIVPNGMKKYECETKPADLTVDIISKFVSEVMDGSIAPSLKSEPIPEKNDAPVKYIVGKQFDEIVKDETKDVFVKYYAPWCGHCKKLAEPWTELATNMAQYPNLVIGKFDATANEAEGVEVRGYPTLIFYPKDNKAGISYDGDRDVESFTAWLKENAPTIAGHADAVKDDL
jgi:protein disulfide-isomerase A1